MANLKRILLSMFIQAVITREYMQGFIYNMLNGDLSYVNTNPYFTTMMLGVFDISPGKKDVYASFIATFGDNFIWNHLRPIVLITALLLMLNGLYSYLPIPLLIYIVIVNTIRIYGYKYSVVKLNAGEIFFTEFYWQGMLRLMRLIKFILLGSLFAYVLYLFLFYLKINIYYVIISILIILLYIVKRWNVEFFVIIMIILLNIRIL